MDWISGWRVTVDGRDVSGPMRPLLMSVEVQDRDGTSSDSARLVFDDTDGQCLLPRTGARLAVYLDGVKVFEGVVDSTPWTITRGGGRILTIGAKGFDTRGKAKEGQRWHLDDASLADALRKGARKAGLDILVDPAFDGIRRDYWTPDGASFLGWAQSLAADLGATFKIRGDKAVFAARGSGISPAGEAMPTIDAVVGRNVIAVSIDPSKGRRSFRRARVRSLDRERASFRETIVEIDPEGEDEGVENVRRFTAADEDEARAFGEGRRRDAERESAEGSVTMLLSPEARAEGTLTLTGARPGIDGTYRIVGVTHRCDRGTGSETVCDIAQPQGGVGKDARQAANGRPSIGSVPIPTPAPR